MKEMMVVKEKTEGSKGKARREVKRLGDGLSLKGREYNGESGSEGPSNGRGNLGQD